MLQAPNHNHTWALATRSLWLKRGLKLEQGVPSVDIESVELAVSFEFPAEMRALYREVNGFRNSDMDVESMISIWPMGRIRQEYNANPDRNFIGFCDFLINSHAIGFFKDRKGVFKSYDAFNPISETFLQSIDLINTASELIF